MQQKLTIIIAPVGLQQALLVLLQTQVGYEPIVCATKVPSLSTILNPHLFIYAMGKETTSTEVQAVKATWPAAHLLVLAVEPEQQALAQDVGADIVLLQGTSPQRLLEAIRLLSHIPHKILQ